MKRLNDKLHVTAARKASEDEASMNRLASTVGNIILAGLGLLTLAMVALICMVLSRPLEAQVRFEDTCGFFRQGWQDGWCEEVLVGYCSAPMPPLCQEWYYDSPTAAYQAGYHRGLEERRNRNY